VTETVGSEGRKERGEEVPVIQVISERNFSGVEGAEGGIVPREKKRRKERSGESMCRLFTPGKRGFLQMRGGGHPVGPLRQQGRDQIEGKKRKGRLRDQPMQVVRGRPAKVWGNKKD